MFIGQQLARHPPCNIQLAQKRGMRKEVILELYVVLHGVMLTGGLNQLNELEQRTILSAIQNTSCFILSLGHLYAYFLYLTAHSNAKRVRLFRSFYIAYQNSLSLSRECSHLLSPRNPSLHNCRKIRLEKLILCCPFCFTRKCSSLNKLFRALQLVFI